MRVNPILPEDLDAETRFVHDEVFKLVTRSQSPVTMTNAGGALIGPFPPMLKFPQFGMSALSFVKSLDTHATLPKKVKEVAILTVGAAFNAKFELYAHEIMAEHVGFSKAAVAALAAGNRPAELTDEEAIAYEVADILANGIILPTPIYDEAKRLLGENGTAELLFLVSAYAMLAMVLNGFDVPVPETAI